MAISLLDFNNLSQEEKKETLKQLKNNLGVSGLAEAWNVSRSKIYSMLKEFDIALDSRKGSKVIAQKPEESLLSDNNESDNNVQPASELNDVMPKESKKRSSRRASKVLLGSDDKKGPTKFSFYMDTHGTGRILNETLNLLLASDNLSNTNLHINITIQEM